MLGQRLGQSRAILPWWFTWHDVAQKGHSCVVTEAALFAKSDSVGKKVRWTQALNIACSDNDRVISTRRRSNVHEVHNPINVGKKRTTGHKAYAHTTSV